MTNDKTRDYNLKKNIIRCDKCHTKLYYLNSTHHCIKYEPVGMGEQIIADEIDNENNRNKTGLYFDCNGQQYRLTTPFEPIEKYIHIPQVDIIYDSKPQIYMYTRFECQFCGQQINEHQRQKHQSTKKCKRIKAKYYIE